MPPSTVAYYAVTGRIIGDDEDTVVSFDHPCSVTQAREMFFAHLRKEDSDGFDSAESVINSVLWSNSPINVSF